MLKDKAMRILMQEKKQAEWMKGKFVKPDCSPSMNRIGWSEGCK